MHDFDRRNFLKLLAAMSAAASAQGRASAFHHPAAAEKSSAARIVNEYTAYLPGEKTALAAVPKILSFAGPAANLVLDGERRRVNAGEQVGGWRLLVIAPIDGKATAVFEKHVTHRGVIAYVTVETGTVAAIPKWVGDLARIRPRQIAAAEEVQLRRAPEHVPGPDRPGDSILNSADDPCYENVAALGAEYIGWTLVANELSGPESSLYLGADGRSREWNDRPSQAAWAPDELGAVFDPEDFLPGSNPQNWDYEKGYSKRTLLGGYLPVADIGLWNPQYNCGYEAMVLLPEGPGTKPMGRVRVMLPDRLVTAEMKVHRDEQGRAFLDSYKNGDAASFFTGLASIWKQWNEFFNQSMPVEIPDEWLLAGARAGLMLCRCSYRGLRPTYQIGEGAYTKIPERSHALFPVAHYEFIWAHQLWNLTGASDKYFQFYLDNYILADGNFLYNIQDQVEAPFCVGMVLWNSARGYFYEGNLAAFQRRLPVLRRMAEYVLNRYAYSQKTCTKDDPHYGLIWGSPEADWGDPKHDTPDAHPYYYENAAGVWRGLKEHSRALTLAAESDPSLAEEAVRTTAAAKEMREDIERSLETTRKRRSPAMKAAGITPFTPEDVNRNPTQLASYENHRYMQDWFLADWGDPGLDLGHLKHRQIAGMQLAGLEIDDNDMRTSNFMAHGTLAVRIRQRDYRPFLLTLYSLACFTMDSGNRYSPEDAMIPGGFPGEGNRYWWSSVVNSALQPAMGLRWLLCYEEADEDICHLQKAAPKHWFKAGEHIRIRRCPTRFGPITWHTNSLPGNRYVVKISLEREFSGDLHLHIHPADGTAIQRSSEGRVEDGYVLLDRDTLRGKRDLQLEIS